MKTDELREKYLSFFETKGHVRRPSDVLVPTWDPSVLFTPAGMNQFKPHFLGKVKLEFTRATTCQKCLRTGDIENVGRTAYHHTFFEMLGNFSFGDYFKREAITWAWEFLTGPQWLGLEPERLSATVYVEDEEAARIWAEDIGLPGSRVQRMGEADNFWPANAPSQGPDGVCGPCSEIFYTTDRGESVEIWNLVFTQFNRVGPPPNNLRPLPSKNIDTGMGLERTAAVLQGVETNFHIDILRPIVEAAAEVCQVRYEPETEAGRRLRRITDHVRACTFAIHENVYPGPNKEKYVIRRLLRRAVLEGHQLGRRQPFLHQLVPVVAQMMKEPYPELQDTTERVAGVIRQEEQAFLETIDEGLQRIERIFASMDQQGRRVIDGQEAAELYQTFGVPAELFESLAAERGYTFDWTGFRAAMEAHGEASGKLVHTVMGHVGPVDALKKAVKETTFLGYDTTRADAEVKGIIVADQLVERVSEEDLSDPEQPIVVVLDQTPFYGESGGQVGDTGRIEADECQLEVFDTQRDGDLILHYTRGLKGTLATGMKVHAEVDRGRRDAIRRAHSATHILHHALQTHLGSHAQQQGSKVTDDWLRFDFTHLSAVAPEELENIARDVRKRIEAGEPIAAQIVPLTTAREAGAMMLFGEKYPDPVRMVTMGQFSRELCGGTHLSTTAEVGAFEIVSEEGVSAGTRRITALTGEKARQYRQQCQEAVDELARLLDTSPATIPTAIADLVDLLRALRKAVSGSGKIPETTEKKTKRVAQPATEEAAVATAIDPRHLLRDAARRLNVPLFEVPARVQALRQEAARLQEQMKARQEQGTLSAKDLLETAEVINDTRLIVAHVPQANANLLRQLIDQIRKTAAPCAILLATTEGEHKVTLVAGVSRDLIDRVRAGDIVKQIAPIVGGGGGGKPDMAQAGGKLPAKLPEALQRAQELLRDKLAAAKQ